MRASISTPFVDTRAADLVWTLGHPLVDPLAARTVEVPGFRVELRVLGASHQVVLRPGTAHGGPVRPDSPEGRPAAAILVETVACLPGVSGNLPDNAERPSWGFGDYRFDSVVESLPRTELTHRMDRLQSEISGSPCGLLVAFPGDPLAITALHLTLGSEGPLHWRTWHAYPQSGELVTTTATVSP